jgi:hypothetical protein
MARTKCFSRPGIFAKREGELPFTKKVAGGFEYYGSTGPLTGFDPLREQQQQIFPAVDFDFGPDWELNFGFGVGITQSTDHLMIKMILGRRFQL